MLKVLSFQKLKYFLLAFQILFVLFLLFNSQFSSAQVCLPLEGYLVWSGTSGNWEQGRIPMASSSPYALTASPFYVSGGNVGLNTTNPVYTLDVRGTTSVEALCIRGVCRSAWPSGGITGSGSQNQVAFWTDTYNLSGSSNLLWNNNTSTLQVNGSVVANNFLGTINASNVSAGTFGANTGGGNYSFPGNVGIGTTAPRAKLDVNGGALFSSTAGGTTGHVKILSSGSVAGQGGLLLTQVAGYTAGTGAFKLYNTGTGGLNGSLHIAHVDQGTPDTVTNLVTIQANGNVGIGTTAPAQKLHVVGDVAIDGNVGIGTPAPDNKLVVLGIATFYEPTTSMPMMLIQLPVALPTNGYPLADSRGLYLWWENAYGYFGLINDGDDRNDTAIIWGWRGSSHLRFIYRGWALGTFGDREIIRIMPDGLVGINNKLYFMGNGECCGYMGDTYIDHPGDGILSFVSNGSEKMRIIPNGNIGIGKPDPIEKLDVVGNVRASSFIQYSDIRLKKNIEPLTVSGSLLEKLNNLEGVYFKWNDVYKNSLGDDKRHIGLIAQEVEKEFPELVSRGNGDSDYLSVDYSRFTAVLLEGLKELNQKLEEFKNKIENSILKVKELIADFIQVKKIRVDKIEMVDQKTGEIYCTWLENGEFQKSKGECR